MTESKISVKHKVPTDLPSNKHSMVSYKHHCNPHSRASSFSQFQDDLEEVDIEVPREECSIVMPLDNSYTGLYVLYYYLKKIHKPENIVHACFVSDDFIMARAGHKASSNVISRRKSCCRLFRRTVGADNYVVDVGPSPGVLAELRKIDRLACIKVKHRVKHLFNKNGINWDFRRLRGADPGKAILQYRNDIGGDIIVMGSRGTSLLSSIVYGSVSTKVLTQSMVPVLVIRRPLGALEGETCNKETKIG